MVWDGGGLNYQTDGLILYPHFSDNIIEGWSDKFLPWRTFNKSVLDRMILISPSKAFIKSLPDSKISDRKDFEVYFKNDKQRISNWYEVVERGKEMAEEFNGYWRSGDLVDVI